MSSTVGLVTEHYLTSQIQQPIAINDLRRRLVIDYLLKSPFCETEPDGAERCGAIPEN